MEATMHKVFAIAEKEDVDVEEVFQFAITHFATFYDHPTAKDWQEFLEGGKTNPYIERLIGYPRNTN